MAELDADSDAVLDASAMVDLLVVAERAPAVRAAVAERILHVPAHFHAEVLSALGRLHQAGELTAEVVTDRLMRLVAAPVRSHDLPPLLLGAWGRRHRLALLDAPYVHLAEQLRVPLVTSDRGLAAAYPRAVVP